MRICHTSYKAGDGCNYKVCNIYFEESNARLEMKEKRNIFQLQSLFFY